MFPIVGFLVCQILESTGLQIEMEGIFSLVKIYINLRRCCL
jgi:hypothetical protein